ncbi:MAG: DNA polymerase III subunit alpha, partial [Acidobacteriota bacterium]|nr:DNA polymerase III subunit alpha [Acidobacteriota bacterium]
TDRLKDASDQFYLKNADEMYALFPDDGQAIENTLGIAERCQFDISMGDFHLPEFPVPDGYSLDSFLVQMATRGLDERLAELRERGAEILTKFSPELYRQRLQSEIDIIQRMGFAGYFLIVWDFIRHAREHRIPVGPGRGSAAGSLVAFALRITDIDPLQYGLLFERFLNPERVSLPDIDIDFCMRRRGEVIQYVSEKYGRGHVAQIITFGTLAAKAVVRDVGRVMGLPYSKVDRIAKLLPDMTRSLRQAAVEIEPLSKEVAADPEVARIVEVGSRLEGLTRHASLHAAGVVITPRPTQELVPLYKTSKGEVVTQWDKDVIEELGLLKMDFLGLRTLTVIDDTLEALKRGGIDLDLDRIRLDDEAVFRLFCDGRTSGIFQFESRGMTDLLQRAKPSKFEDLAAFNALYRPGALTVGMVEEYIQRKLGKRRVKYVLPETRPILEETYGVVAYQEQVMQLAVEVAGFSMGEADVLRKAMGKKQPEVMAKQHQKFIEGAVARGVAKRKAQELWEYIEPFAGYGFNKSHSVAYAMLAYKTAFLKAHYPVAFMSAMLTSEMSSRDNVAKYISECRQMGIPVLPPDVNESSWTFTVVEDTIRFGLGAVKGLGSSAVEAILEARQRAGRFVDFTQFAREVDLKAVNHRAFECLIKSGSFDSFGSHRRALLSSLDPILEFAQRQRRAAEEGQGSLFSSETMPQPGPDTSLPEWEDRERLSYEKEVLGFYLTGNPLAEYSEALERQATHSTAGLADGAEGTIVVGGVVTRMRQVKIRGGRNAGRMMGRFVLEDIQGSVSVTLFADQLQKFASILENEAVVLVRGTLRERGSDKELAAEEIVALEDVEKKSPEFVELVMDREFSGSEMLALRDTLIENQGETPVRFEIDLGAVVVRVVPEKRFRVSPEPDVIAALESIVGAGCVRTKLATQPV